ncbi:MAG TPA: cyclic nucleotide-binding domain-containing protein, partial [Dehalococcoidia bacterium]|nr:cyclic nucleotide-binding domain-containing protein [Dehalococcoidia bacterium]
MQYSMMLKEQTVTKKAAATEDLVYARRILNDSILFRSLGDEKIHQLIALASIRYLKKQEYIVRENDPVNDFFVILRGQVKVLMLGKGGRAFTIDIYTQGNTFLSTSFFSGQPAWGSAMAMEPVALMHIPRKRFLPFIVANPELTLVYLGYLSEGFGLAIRHIENCLTRKVD